METAREKNLTISNLQSNDWRSWSNRGFKRLFDVFSPPSSVPRLRSPVFSPPSSVSCLSSSNARAPARSSTAARAWGEAAGIPRAIFYVPGNKCAAQLPKNAGNYPPAP
jgi:hypothetical protein